MDDGGPVGAGGLLPRDRDERHRCRKDGPDWTPRPVGTPESPPVVKRDVSEPEGSLHASGRRSGGRYSRGT